MTSPASGRSRQGETESAAVDQLGLLGALGSHVWLALLTIAFFGLLGILIIRSQPPMYVAEAGLIVEDARATRDFNVTETEEPTSNLASERYLADQVEILQSTQVAEIASANMAEVGAERPPEFILRNRSVTGEATNNLITVTFEADTPEIAKLGADSVVAGYVELRERQVQQRLEQAQEEVDALQASLQAELESIEEEISAVRGSNEARRTMQQQLDEALATMNSLRQQRAELSVGSVEREAINTQLDELRQDFEAWDVMMGIENQSSELAALIARRDAAIAEIASLAAQENSIAVDAQLESSGVVLSDPAPLPDEPAGPPPALILAAAIALGLGVAAALAYFLEVREKGVTSRSTPEGILGAPLMAEVPSFKQERVKSDQPVNAAPSSASAEAFRFAAAALDVRASRMGVRSVLVTSATVGAGKTVTVANTGIAAASEGLRILVIDADFGQQKLTSLLGVRPPFGLTEVAAGVVDLERALETVQVAPDRSLTLLSRGWERVEAPTFLRSDRFGALFEELCDRFDLVLIDGPPLLQVAYASTLAHLADSAIIVVEHASPRRMLEDIRDRLELVETPILGYLYTKAPLRPEMTASEGSTADILGTRRGANRAEEMKLVRSRRD